MAAHRFWKLQIITSASGSGVTIGELVLATEPSGPQAAIGGTAYASREEASWPASAAFDGAVVQGSGWWSQIVPCGITYDMGEGRAIEVVEVRITSPSGATPTNYPTSVALMFSDDGKTWMVRRAWSGMVFSALETKTLDATPLPSSQIASCVVMDKTIRRNISANYGEPTFRRALSIIVDMAVNHGSMPARKTPWTGEHFIAGSTTSLGDPIARRVDLVDQKSGLLAFRMQSGKDGSFRFNDIGPGPWTVIGIDPSAEQNSVIYAHVTPSRIT